MTFLPPILTKVDPARYPEHLQGKQNEKLLLHDYPGGALIERDMMQFMRWTCAISIFFISPWDWYSHRRRILNEAEKAKIKMLLKLQRNLAMGAVCGAVMGAAKAVLSNWNKPEADVVKEAVWLRTDREMDRWSRTTGRLATAAVLPMILYTSGPLPIRVACGFGLGVVASVPVSATELDFAFYYALPGT